MAAPYRSLAETPFDVNFLQHSIDIERPPAEVWPHAQRIGLWMNKHELSTVDGTEGEPGFFERVYPRGLGPDVEEPRYHVYGIAHTIPNELIVLQVMPENGGSYGEPRPYVSFDTIQLVALGNGSTRVIVTMIDAQLGKDEESARARAELIHSDATHEQIAGNLETLKAQAEAG